MGIFFVKPTIGPSMGLGLSAESYINVHEGQLVTLFLFFGHVYTWKQWNALIDGIPSTSHWGLLLNSECVRSCRLKVYRTFVL